MQHLKIVSAFSSQKFSLDTQENKRKNKKAKVRGNDKDHIYINDACIMVIARLGIFM
jgi:hypothetical protein